MKVIVGVFGSVLAMIAAQSASAETVFNTSLPNLNSSRGGGVATTTTTANGTVTTVVGTAGDPNRVSATPTAGWYQDSVGAGGSVGITKTFTNDGNGAAYFSTVNGDSKGDLRHSLTTLVPLASLATLSYDFYRAPSSTTGANFAPVLRLDIAKDGAYAGSLVFEYLYQNQTTPPVNAWTTLSATLGSGIFWATNSKLGPTFAAADGGQKTLAAWIAGNAGSTLSVFGMSTGVGSGWSGTFSGAVDHIDYAFAGGPSANYDFAVANVGGVPEPASWALMIGGFGLVGATARRRRAIAA